MNGYPEKIWKLFREPRRAGRLDEVAGVVTGRAGTPAGHAQLQIQLRLAADGRIEDAVFQALGCPWLIATGGWLCSYLIGRRADAVDSLDSESIAEQLELTAVKRYCAVMAVEALHSALAVASKKRATSQVEPNDE